MVFKILLLSGSFLFFCSGDASEIQKPGELRLSENISLIEEKQNPRPEEKTDIWAIMDFREPVVEKKYLYAIGGAAIFGGSLFAVSKIPPVSGFVNMKINLLKKMSQKVVSEIIKFGEGPGIHKLSEEDKKTVNSLEGNNFFAWVPFFKKTMSVLETAATVIIGVMMLKK